MRHHRLVVVALSIAVSLNGCASSSSAPDFGRAAAIAEAGRLDAIAPAAGGSEMSGGRLKRSDLVTALRRLEDASIALGKCPDDPSRCRFTLRLERRSEIDASVRAGRRITVTQGLLDRCRTADEAAFVLAHEMGHVFAAHLDRTERRASVAAVLLQGTLIAAGALAGFAPSARDLKGVGAIGADLGDRVYSRQQELEADLVGQELLIAAGFEAGAGVDLFERLAQMGDGSRTPWSSHPALAERVDRLQALPLHRLSEAGA